MLRILLAILSILASAPVYGGEEPVPETVISGHIVMYDWVGQGRGLQETFVVRSTSQGKQPQYFKVVYYHFEAQLELSLTRLVKPLPKEVYAGRGATVRFRLHKARTENERFACEVQFPDLIVRDSLGIGKIPRMIRSPGALNEEIPPIESLPCWILKEDQINIQKNSADWDSVRTSKP